MHIRAKFTLMLWTLAAAVASGGEEIMPLRPGTPDPGWQRATSIDSKSGRSAAKNGELRKNVIRLKIPVPVSSRGDPRVRLVKAGEDPDGRLDFSLIRPGIVPVEPTAIPAIPGLITPEELALDHLNAIKPDSGTSGTSDLWSAFFPEPEISAADDLWHAGIVRDDFPDWGDSAWPEFPSPALPRQEHSGDNDVGATFIPPPAWPEPLPVSAGPPLSPQSGALLPPSPSVETTGSLRPPGMPGSPHPVGRVKSIDDDRVGVSRALSFGRSDSATETGAAEQPDNGGVSTMSQAEYLRRKNAYDPSRFSGQVEPVAWPEPLPGPVEPWAPTIPLPTRDAFERPSNAKREESADHTPSGRCKPTVITPVRELKNALQPIRRMK